MRQTERFFDPSQTFYALKSMKFAGRDYKRGDIFPSRDITNKQLLKLYQNSFVGYESDFRDNKASIKEVEIEKETPEVPQEEPKQTTTKRSSTKRQTRRKKTTED